MELFTITCTTCQQRLKVRDASTIGEIQICPKCGSMVLVQPPPGWSAPQADEPPARSLPAAPPQDVPPEPAAGLEPLVAPPPTAADVSVEPQASLSDESRADTDLSGAAIEAPPAGGAPLAPPTDGELVASEPILPTDDWASQAARRRQQWLMLGGAAVAGVALAFGLVGFFASRAANQARQIAAQAPAAPGAAVSGDPTPPQGATPEPAPPAVEPAAATNSAPSRPSADVPGGRAHAKPDAPIADPSASPQTPPTAPVLADEPKAASPKPDAAPVADQPAKKPSEPPQTVQPAKPKDVNLDPGALSETLKAFAPFIDPNANPAPPESMDAAEPDMPQLDPQAVTTQPSVPRPEPRQVDVPARLLDKIAEVEFADVPLKNFLRFIMNFSTIPISLDPDALALVRATPRTKISLRKTDATVGQLLTAVLDPLQLAPVAVDQQLVITRPPLPDGGLRAHWHGVSDLVGNDPQRLTQLVDLIVETVDPSAWEAAGGPGVLREQLPSLVIQQRDTVLFRVLIFCERLRAARGLPPQSKFNPELFSLEPRLARAAPRLAKPVTLNFPQPAPFARILDRLGDESGVDVLVDWPALAQLGWTLDTETTLAANQQPVGEVLTSMLQPMDLTYRVLDPGTVQITSPAAADARWDIEFYPVIALLAPGQSPDALVTRVRNDLTGGNPGALAGVLRWDAPSQHLIAALPQPQQRKLAELLKTWGQGPR